MKTKILIQALLFCLAPSILTAQPFSQLVRKFKFPANQNGNICINNDYIFSGNFRNNITDTIFIYSISTGNLVGSQHIIANGSSGGFGIKATYNRMYVGADMYTLKSYDISNILNWSPLQTINGLDQGFLRGMMSGDSTIIAWGGHWASTYQFFDISSGSIVAECKVNTNGNNYNSDRYQNYVYVENAYSGDVRVNINNLSSCSVSPYGGSCGGCPHVTLTGLIVYGPRTSSCNPQRIEIYNQSNVMTGSLMSTDYSQALCLPDNYVLVNNYPINKQVLYNIYDGTFNHPFDTVFNTTSGGFLFNNNYIFRFINDTCEVYSRFAPNVQATNVVFSNIQNNQLSIDWTDGNGSNRAVFIKQDNVGVASPSFNTTYTANTAFGLGTQIGTSGWYCVFNGTTHPSGVTVTNLLSNTTYRVMVCEYNGVVGAEQYNISSAINNPINSITQNSSCPSSFIDGRDGKTYHGIQIGNQCWMKENLNYGIKINDTQNPSNNGITEKHCYNNDENNCTIYGGLYSWMEMMQYESTPGIQGICPSGWYIPTDDEWTVLTSYLGGESIAGGKLKETGYTHWMSPNTGATNISGFSALGAGDRNYWVGGGYANLMLNERIWSSTPVNSSDSWYRELSYNQSTVNRTYDYGNNGQGFSVRCLKAISDTSLPTTQASNIIFSNVQPNQFTFNWIDGNGSDRVVFICQDSLGSATPINSASYSPNTVFGLGTQIGATGWYCIFNGTTHPSGVTVSNLLSNTTYRVMVCEYNGVVGSERYNTSIAINNPLNQKTCGGGIPTNGLSAWYPFNGNANDLSGNGNDGTVNGATLTTDRFGNPNSAYSFNGTTDFIGINNTSLANFGTSNFTIAGWVNLTDYSYPGTSVIFAKRNTGVYGNFVEFDINNWKIKGEIDENSASNYSVVESTTNVGLNTWYFGVFVRDSNTIRMYFNGILEGEITTPIIQNINNSGNASIGDLSGGGGWASLHGKIDDIRIYNRALSDCEISSLYNEASTFIVTTTANPINAGTTSGGGTYQNGAQVTVEAVSNTGWSFENWTENGTIVSAFPLYTFVVSENRNLVANFVQQALQYTITATANPSNAGYTTGGGVYNAGDSVTVEAFANSGWVFVNWTEFGSQVSTSPAYTFIVTDNRDLVANFVQMFVITANSNPLSAGYTTGGGVYTAGQTATLQAFSYSGWSFYNWTENGVQVSSNQNYSFVVNSNRSIEANFLSEVGLDEQLYTGVSVSPNPTKGKIGVKSELQIDEILVYNSMGIQVIRLNVGDKQLILDLSQYDKGIYYLRMKMGEQFQTHKLILL